MFERQNLIPKAVGLEEFNFSFDNASGAARRKLIAGEESGFADVYVEQVTSGAPNLRYAFIWLIVPRVFPALSALADPSLQRRLTFTSHVL
jgi:hypothetical protein